jgi:hypothetical protein
LIQKYKTQGTLGDFKGKRRYFKLNEAALDQILGRTRFEENMDRSQDRAHYEWQ